MDEPPTRQAGDREGLLGLHFRMQGQNFNQTQHTVPFLIRHLTETLNQPLLSLG